MVVILRRTDGHYEFPFFAVATSTLYFGIQLVLFAFDQGQTFAPEIAFFAFFATLVNIALHAGFRRGAKNSLKRRLTFHQTKFRWLFPFLLHLVLVLLGLQAFLLLSSMSGGVSTFLNTAGANIVWEGRAVQYTFAIQNFYFVYPICLFIWRGTGNRAFLALGVFSLIIPVIYAVMLNRRFVLFLLLSTFYLFLFFQYRLVMRKALIVILAPLAMVVVTIFPLLRSAMSIQEAIAARKLTGIELIIGQNFNEVHNGALSLMASFLNSEHEYGLGFIKQVIKDFIPSSVIGREMKSQLLGPDGLREIVYGIYRFDIPEHEFLTGVTIGFFQLGFLSLVLWYIVGFYFGNLWTRARKYGELKDQIMYTSMIPVGMMALYFSPTAAFSQAIKVWVIVNITFLFARLVIMKKPAG